jgi:hypothetical protein
MLQGAMRLINEVVNPTNSFKLYSYIRIRVGHIMKLSRSNIFPVSGARAIDGPSHGVR